MCPGSTWATFLSKNDLGNTDNSMSRQSIKTQFDHQIKTENSLLEKDQSKMKKHLKLKESQQHLRM